MSEHGRYVETDKVAMGVWVRIVKLFATWKMLLAGSTRRSWMQFHNDQLSILTRSKHWKTSLGLLGGLSDAQVAFLRDYARLNSERVERIFRMTALLFITVPVGAAVALNEIAPELWEALGVTETSTLLILILAYGVIVGYMMMVAWRSRDLIDLMEFELARRRLVDARTMDP